jgi:hypothetical protein
VGKPGGVFVPGIVTGFSNVAVTIAGFISMEMSEGCFAAFRQRPNVAMTGVVPIIDVPVEAVRTVEPGTGANENSA